MKMRNCIVLMLFAGLLLLVGCEKGSPDGMQGTCEPEYASDSCEEDSPDGLHGRWEPVYACGSHKDNTYTCFFEGSVDGHGVIPAVMVGNDNPDLKYETSITIAGIRFFRQDGKDVFTTFMKDSPRKEIGKPLQYRIEDGMLYCELPMGAFINCSPDILDEGSGVFDEGTPISFLSNGQLKIGDITYSRI